MKRFLSTVVLCIALGMVELDVTVLVRVIRACNWLQQTVGINSIQVQRVVGWLVMVDVAGIAYHNWVLHKGGTFSILLSLLFLGLMANLVYGAHKKHREEAERRLVSMTLNPAISKDWPVRIVNLLIAIYIITSAVISVLTSHYVPTSSDAFNPLFTLWFYLDATDPLPPGTSKLREYLQSFQVQREPVPA